MIVLPYSDLSVVENEPPLREQRIVEIKNLGREIWEVCHIAINGDGYEFEEYLFPIGYMNEGSIVTHKKVIIEESERVSDIRSLLVYKGTLPLVRQHFDLYCKKVGVIPKWGTQEFFELFKQGRTVRVLEGPHKASGLKKGEGREVILTENNKLVYGPKL